MESRCKHAFLRSTIICCPIKISSRLDIWHLYLRKGYCLNGAFRKSICSYHHNSCHSHNFTLLNFGPVGLWFGIIDYISNWYLFIFIAEFIWRQKSCSHFFPLFLEICSSLSPSEVLSPAKEIKKDFHCFPAHIIEVSISSDLFGFQKIQVVCRKRWDDLKLGVMGSAHAWRKYKTL